MNKDGITVARCTVERPMQDMGLQGCQRGRIWIRTTVGDDTLERPADLVKRRFEASAPNLLWLADLTYVKTSTGWVYVAFIIDVYPRMIVGWQASRSLHTDLAIDALEMAVFNRGRLDSLEGLIHHNDPLNLVSTCRCGTRNALLITTSWHRSDPRATAMSTRSSSPSTGSTSGS